MKLIPLFDRVVIKPEVQSTTTKSGIVLPSTSQERPQIGRVIAIGSGLDIDANNVGMQVRVGDMVLFNKFAGGEVKVDDVSRLVSVRVTELTWLLSSSLTSMRQHLHQLQRRQLRRQPVVAQRRL